MEKGERFFQGAIHLTCFRHLFIDEMTHSLEMLIYLNFGNIRVTPFLVSVGIGKYFIHHGLRDLFELSLSKNSAENSFSKWTLPECNKRV